MVSRETFKETSSCWPAVSKRACQQSKTNFCSKKKRIHTSEPPTWGNVPISVVFSGTPNNGKGAYIFFSGIFWYKFHEKNSPNRHLHLSSCKGLLAGSWAPQINGSTWCFGSADDKQIWLVLLRELREWSYIYLEPNRPIFWGGWPSILWVKSSKLWVIWVLGMVMMGIHEPSFLTKG